MSKEYDKKSNKIKEALNKYRESLIKVAIGGIIAVFGLTIPASVFISLLDKIVVLDGETTVLIAVLSKVLLMAGGVIGGVYNNIKASLTKNEINKLEDEQQELVLELENEKNIQAEKIQSLKKDLEQIKDEVIALNSQKGSGKKIQESKIEDFHEVDLEKQKNNVKRK